MPMTLRPNRRAVAPRAGGDQPGARSRSAAGSPRACRRAPGTSRPRPGRGCGSCPPAGWKAGIGPPRAPPRHHHGHELRRLAIEEVDPRIAPLEEPLAEIGEAGEAGRRPSRRRPAGCRWAPRARSRRLAAQAEHPPRLEHGAVLEERLDRLLDRLRGVAPHLARAARRAGRSAASAADRSAPTPGDQMAERMAVDPLPGLVDQELKGLVDAFFTFGCGQRRPPWRTKMKTRQGGRLFLGLGRIFSNSPPSRGCKGGRGRGCSGRRHRREPGASLRPRSPPVREGEAPSSSR